jgi:hypothetical protein
MELHDLPPGRGAAFIKCTAQLGGHVAL